MATITNDFYGDVLCEACCWSGDAYDLVYDNPSYGVIVYVCPECFSDRIVEC